MGDDVRADDGPMTCEVCGKEFPSRAAVQEHEREVHGEDRPADLDRGVEDPRPGDDLYAAGPESGETPAGPTQHGAE